MTKRKPVDTLRWAWAKADGRVIVGLEDQSRKTVYDFRDPGETVIRVRVTEVPKKKRLKK